MLAITGAMALTGCAAGHNGPTKLAKGADGGFWTTQPAAGVSACLARSFGGGTGENTFVAPSGSSYVVQPIDNPDVAYRTLVSRLTVAPDDATDQLVALCTKPIEQAE
jgi:hypothetical protein